MAKKTTTKKVEAVYLAKWNKRINGKVEEVSVKVKKSGLKYVALDGKTEIPAWAEIIVLS